MLRDYMLVSPSIEAVIGNDSIVYENIDRPIELLKVLDGPSSKGRSKKVTDARSSVSRLEEAEISVMNRYLHDVYELLQKKISEFLISPDNKPEESIHLQALLQEMIKIKSWKNKKYN